MYLTSVPSPTAVTQGKALTRHDSEGGIQDASDAVIRHSTEPVVITCYAAMVLQSQKINVGVRISGCTRPLRDVLIISVN